MPLGRRQHRYVSVPGILKDAIDQVLHSRTSISRAGVKLYGVQDTDTRTGTKECNNENENQLWWDVENTYTGDDGSPECSVFLCSISIPCDDCCAGDVAKGYFSAF